MNVTDLKSDGSSCNLYLYDSLYTSVDKDTLNLLKKWFGSNINVQLPPMQIQVGLADCGLFAIAVLVALLFNLNPSKCQFEQALTRQHLINCFELNKFVMFP